MTPDLLFLAGFIGLEYDNADRPEAANLLAIYSLVTGKSTVGCIYLFLQSHTDLSWQGLAQCACLPICVDQPGRGECMLLSVVEHFMKLRLACHRLML